jgi:hypothetical protein
VERIERIERKTKKMGRTEAKGGWVLILLEVVVGLSVLVRK